MTSKRIFLIILVAHTILALIASVVNPLHEATDELRHYRFVRHIVELGSLPVQGQVGCSAQGHHPPLFYGLAAAATFWVETGRDVCYAPPTNPFWAYRNWDVGVDNKNQYLHGADETFPWAGEALAAHLARMVNVLIGAGVVWLTWLLGQALWPDKPALALGGVALVAFNPMFVYMAGAINNDVLAAFSGTAVTLACVRLVQDERGLSRRWGLILGGLMGLALMSKFNLAAMAVVVETAVFWVAWRRGQWRLWLEVNLLIAGGTLLISGWWFWRNVQLYGEPTGIEELTRLWGVRDPSESFGTAVFELPYAWTSLWGRFGYGQIPLPEAIYSGLRWFVGLSLAGLLVPLWRRQWSAALSVLALTVALFFGVLFSYLLVSPAGPMGRFFFPALPALAMLTFYGLTRWPTLWPKLIWKGDGSLAWAVNGGMVMLTLVALFGYLAPAYAVPPSFADTAVVNPNRFEANFGGLVTLRGYEVTPIRAQPGQPIDVTLFWEVTAVPPGNFLMFVHLIDENGIMVAQRDTHPGLGNFPSSLWRVGDRFEEQITLYLPETAYTPAQATLSVGFYAPVEGYRLGIMDENGVGLGDALVLATVWVEAWQDGPVMAVANPLDQNFEDAVLLVGYEYDRRTVPLGSEVALTLYWQALVPIPQDYLVQFEWVDEAGQVRKVVEKRPLVPTTTWIPGQIVNDSYQIGFDTTLSPGSYAIHAALLDFDTKQRQNIVADDGHLLNDHVTLARIRVTE